MPELIRQNRSFAPRGAEMPDGLPDLQAEVNRKSEVWAYNIEGYYEEAMSRQWNATTDIPWADLAKTELPEDIGKAYAQLLTFLTEVEMIATDVPAKWMGRLNADFFEVKNFIATQAMDEARHAEVFRKRALTTGFGLMQASPQNETTSSSCATPTPSPSRRSRLHLQAEGMVLTLFRFSEYISPTDGDKKLFRLVMQDEARHVGYGMQHLKWVLDHFPEKREIIHRHLDEAENFVFGGGYATEVMEPFIILSGKGMKKENIAAGHQDHRPVPAEADRGVLRAPRQVRAARAPRALEAPQGARARPGEPGGDGPQDALRGGAWSATSARACIPGYGHQLGDDRRGRSSDPVLEIAQAVLGDVEPRSALESRWRSCVRPVMIACVRRPSRSVRRAKFRLLRSF